MGYRSYQIVKNSESDIYVYCRANLSTEFKRNVSTPFPFIRLYSRAAQLILNTFGQGILYKLVKKVEIDIFSFRAKKFISEAQIVHFFYHDERLIDYAKSLGKKVIIEAFSHPAYLKKMRNEGIKFDSDNEKSDDHSVPCYEKSDMIISPSFWVSQNLSYAGLPESKVKLVHYGVHKQPNKSYVTGKKLKIVFAGGLKRTKGVLDLLEAVGKLDPETVELNVFGRIHNNIAKELNVLIHDKKNIHIKGFSNNIIEEYKSGDLYVYPTYFEGSSKTVFEAMSCGLAVITTFNAGSIVRDKVDGFLIPINEASIIEEKIQFFLDNPLSLIKMGQSAQVFSREFSWENYAVNVSNIYKRV
jgi:glycosyltransferase involved in cell wall biosynthesis